MAENKAKPAAVEEFQQRPLFHLAFPVTDLEATQNFYVDVLGMPLVHAMKVPPGLGTGPGNRDESRDQRGESGGRMNDHVDTYPIMHHENEPDPQPEGRAGGRWSWRTRTRGV